jgi:hypothetical protein
MSRTEIKVLGEPGSNVSTIAAEIAQALRLLGFKTTVVSNVSGKFLSESKSQTKRIKELVLSESNHILITCDLLPGEKSHAKSAVGSE